MTIKRKNNQLVNILRSIMDGKMHPELTRDRVKISSLIGKLRTKPTAPKKTTGRKGVIDCTEKMGRPQPNFYNTCYY